MLNLYKSFKYVLLTILISSMLVFPSCGQGSSMGGESIIGLALLAWQLGVFDKGDKESNHPPQILTLTATPNTVVLGGTTILTVVAADSDSGDTLTYIWTSSAGTLQKPSEAATVWTAPTDTSGTFYINITVSDGKDSVTGRVPVVVTL